MLAFRTSCAGSAFPPNSVTNRKILVTILVRPAGDVLFRNALVGFNQSPRDAELLALNYLP
jgi:hypothetical protein